jgi:hypothetical protein
MNFLTPEADVPRSGREKPLEAIESAILELSITSKTNTRAEWIIEKAILYRSNFSPQIPEQH